MVTKAKKGNTTVVGDMLKRHPLSEKYGPKMNTDEQLAIGIDMKEHGQHDDIILHEGMVLAGWNRYMGGVQQGIKDKLRFRELEKDKDPVAVAFGTNFVRRRLSSVQKAFYGAQFCIDTGKKQTDVAKLMACNLNRLNQCVQLIKSGTDSAIAAIEKIRENPDLSGGAFDELMIEAGIAREAPPPAPAPTRTNTHTEDDDDGLGEDDDITAGGIDSLLGDDDPLEDPPSPRKRKEIGEDAEPLPAVGGSRTKMTNPHETPVSRVAKAFKSLSADEQRTFVKFAWGRLKAALDTAIEKGDVDYVAPERQAGPPDPSIIARPAKKGGKADAVDVEPKAKKAAKPTKAEKAAAEKEATEAIKKAGKRAGKKAVKK